MSVNVRHRLSSRQVKTTVLVASMLVLLLSAGQIVLDLFNERKQIDATVAQILDIVRESAAQAAYSVDEALAAKVLRGLFKYQSIRTAQLVDDFGTVLAQQQRPTTSGWLPWLSETMFGGEFRYAEPLFSPVDKTSVGRIEIGLDGYLLAINFLKRARVLIISGAMLTAILALVLHLMFFASITQPLLTMVSNLSAVDPAMPAKTLLQVPRGHMHDEMGLLTATMNQLLEGFGESLTRRQEVEAQLQERETRIRNIMDSVPDGILTLNEEGIVENCNKAALELFGVETTALVGTRFEQWIAPPEQLRFRPTGDRIFDTKAGDKLSKTLQHVSSLNRQGTTMPVELQFTPLHQEERVLTLCVVRNISERTQLQARLQQAQKMEAVGTLAGGIAHDFNNILAAMIGFAELSQFALPQDSEARVHLQEILNAGQRASDLVQQLLTFSRPSAPAREPLDAAQVVHDMLTLLRASLPATIELCSALDERSGTIVVNRTQLHQLLLNLCTNAAQAMRQTGGRIEISVRPVEVDTAFAALHQPLQPGSYVQLMVRDSGPGIPPEVQERLFEPFFTTKGVGEGSGMGLAIVHGIITSHGGAITVESAVGQGTTFTVYLPRSNALAAAEQIEATASPIQGEGRILLVDDEVSLARLGHDLLAQLGYTVASTTQSQEALTLFRATPDAFDLVITDQTMPKLTGETLAQELRQIRPDIPIILCTGFSQGLTAERAHALGIDALCMKPFHISDLAETIHQVLARRPEA